MERKSEKIQTRFSQEQIQDEELLEDDPFKEENIKARVDHSEDTEEEQMEGIDVVEVEELEEVEGIAAEEEPGAADLEEPAPKAKVKTLIIGYPMKTKNAAEVLETMQRGVIEMERRGMKITRLHTDRGREFISGRMRSWSAQKGWRKTTTSGNEPQSNGRAEAAIGILKRSARVLLIAGNLDKCYWPYALNQGSQNQLRKFFDEKTPADAPYFGERVVVRTKLHDRSDQWDARMLTGPFLGEAEDMSTTRGMGGWVKMDSDDIKLGYVFRGPPAIQDPLETEKLKDLGWEVVRIPDGRKMYRHLESNQTSWDSPRMMEVYRDHRDDEEMRAPVTRTGESRVRTR